jgi:hypothetical protein
MRVFMPGAVVVAVVVVAAGSGCPAGGNRDAIGRACSVEGPPCARDHVCEAGDAIVDGLCAPIDDYGDCGPAAYPLAPGQVRAEGLDVNEAGELGFLRDVVRVEGDLFIDGPFGAGTLQVGDLCGVQGLQQVTGSLLVAQTDVTTLDGLQSVSFVGAGVGIAGNPNLVDLDGLANLVRVVPLEGRNFEIVIANNAALERDALQRFLDALAGRPSIRVIACGNIRAIGLGAAGCGPEIDTLLRRE